MMVLAEIIRIEGVSAKPSEKKPGTYSLKVYIKNVGEENAEINSIYVLNIYGNVFCAEVLNLILSPGDVGYISLECELEKMSQYFVKVSTRKGYESLYSISI